MQVFKRNNRQSYSVFISQDEEITPVNGSYVHEMLKFRIKKDRAIYSDT